MVGTRAIRIGVSCKSSSPIIKIFFDSWVRFVLTSISGDPNEEC